MDFLTYTYSKLLDEICPRSIETGNTLFHFLLVYTFEIGSWYGSRSVFTVLDVSILWSTFCAFSPVCIFFSISFQFSPHLTQFPVLRSLSFLQIVLYMMLCLRFVVIKMSGCWMTVEEKGCHARPDQAPEAFQFINLYSHLSVQDKLLLILSSKYFAIHYPFNIDLSILGICYSFSPNAQILLKFYVSLFISFFVSFVLSQTK